MRAVRTFSTTLRRAGGQPLFDDFVRPLNKEQQKAKRKEESKSDPVFHGTLKRETAFILSAFAPTRERHKERKKAIEQVSQVIREKYGERFSVKDVSLWTYSQDVHDAPLELMISDNNAPNGFEPTQKELPQIYNPKHLASTLLAAGYKGHFNNPRADRIGHVPFKENAFIVPPPLDAESQKVGWLDYIPLVSAGISTPPTLHATAPFAFSITPPYPSAEHTFQYLCRAHGQVDLLRQLTPLLFIWTRSMRINDLPPTCLALMAIRWYQTLGSYPTLYEARHSDSPAAEKAKQKGPQIWMPYRCMHPDSESARLADYITKHVHLDMWYDEQKFQPRGFGGSVGSSFYRLLKFYILPKALWEDRVISVSDKDPQVPTQRQIRFARGDDARVVHERDFVFRDKLKDFSPEVHPSHWMKAFLHVQDPFIPSLNHGQHVSRHSMVYFVAAGRAAVRALSHAHSLPVTFGPNILPPRSTDVWLSKLAAKTRATAHLGVDADADAPAASNLPAAAGGDWASALERRLANGLPQFPPSNTSPEQEQPRWNDEDEAAADKTIEPQPASMSSRWGTPSRVRIALKPAGKRAYHSSALSRQLQPQVTTPIHTSKPPTIDELRNQTIKRVEAAIRDGFGPRYNVMLFGSTVYGADSTSSDLDLVVLDHERKMGFSEDVDVYSLPDIYRIKYLARVLRFSGFVDVEAVPATVPIVKFRDPSTNIRCDLNVNDRLGLINTLLIRRYTDEHPFISPMIAILKAWARSLGLNNPNMSTGLPITFNSYALALMTIGFFQWKGLVGNHQAGLKPFTSDDIPRVNEAFWIRQKKGQRVRCDTRLSIGDRKPGRQQHTMKLNQVITFPELRGALSEWFQFWGSIHNYETSILCVRSGGIIKRRSSYDPQAQIPMFTKQGPRVILPTEEAAHDQTVFGRRRIEPALKTTEVDSYLRLLSQIERRSELYGRYGIKPGSSKRQRPPLLEFDDTTRDLLPKEDTTADAKVLNPEEERKQASLKVATDAQADVHALATPSTTLDTEHDSLILSIGPFVPPAAWDSSLVVVADPFIRHKNVTNALSEASVKYFRSECMVARANLLSGHPIESLLGHRKVGRGFEPIKFKDVMRLDRS